MSETKNKEPEVVKPIEPVQAPEQAPFCVPIGMTWEEAKAALEPKVPVAETPRLRTPRDKE